MKTNNLRIYSITTAAMKTNNLRIYSIMTVAIEMSFRAFTKKRCKGTKKK